MDLLPFFKKAIEKNASDIHLIAGCPPSIRIYGELEKLSDELIDDDELRLGITKIINKDILDRFGKKKEIDVSEEFFGKRFRINLHFQEGKVGLSARIIPIKIPKPEEIIFDDTLYKLTHLQDGLVLVTGPSGVGKSTTLAVMIDIINQERRAHIVTVEDPIEYLFEEKQSLIEQRELGNDTDSFSDALKYALRQDPNIIMVGEMRDVETIAAALTAAETGHLVLSTLHTLSAADTVARIIDVFPEKDHNKILSQLSTCLRAVVAQQILPKKGGGLVVAREIMLNNNAISSLIKRNQVEQIYSCIQTSRKEGMITMNKSIDELLKQGLITEDVARNRKRDLDTKAIYY